MTDQEIVDLLTEHPPRDPVADEIEQHLAGLVRRLKCIQIGMWVLLGYVLFTAPFFFLFAAVLIRDINRAMPEKRPAAISRGVLPGLPPVLPAPPPGN